MRILPILLICLMLVTAASPAGAEGAAVDESAGHAVDTQIEEWESRPDHKLSASLLQYLPRGIFERYAVAFALLMSAVALGMQRKRPWALVFARELGRAPVRVRGYLVPVSRTGVVTPRPTIGLENPGLPDIRIGTGTPYMSYAKDTLIAFQGTNDGSPPKLIVERGQVRIDGEVVTEWNLQNEDVIEVEGLSLQYMRGKRR